MRAFALTVAAVSLLAVASASAAPSHDALIRPGVGIGKVRLGMTFAQVRTALGRPGIVLEQRRFGFGSRYTEYGWNLGTDWIVAIVGTGDRNRVVMVATGLRRERTAKGVGVGSTDRALRRMLGARCSEKTGRYDNLLGPESIVCWLGRSRASLHTGFYLGQECRIPDPHPVQCPARQSVYRVYEVRVGEPRYLWGYPRGLGR